MSPRPTLFLFVTTLLASAGGARAASALPTTTADFIDRHCSSCHNDVDKEGGLDLTTLSYQPADVANFATWVKVHDRVQAGEMPPKEKKRPAAGELRSFVGAVATALTSFEKDAAT